MKSIIVTLWGLMSTFSDIGISDGYVQALDYPVPRFANVNKGLQPLIPTSSGYGGGYGYAPTTKVINVNRQLPYGIAVSSGYGGIYGYVMVPNVINKKLRSNVAISGGYAGGYGYAAVNDIGVNSQLQSSVAISSDYSETPTDFNMNKILPSGLVVPSGYGGAYGYSPTSTVSVKNVISEKEVKMSHVENMRKIFSQMMLTRSDGYSGYGNGISSHSGYSRYPDYAGYGFAYASGWF